MTRNKYLFVSFLLCLCSIQAQDLLSGKGSFDAVNPLNSWTTTTNGNGSFNAITSESYFGTSSLKIEVSQTSSTDVTLANATNFDISSGIVYTASFYLKGKVSNEFSIGLFNDTTEISSQTDTTTLEEWTYYTFSFLSDVSSSNGKIKITFKEIGDYFIDELVVKPGISNKWYVSESGSNGNSGNSISSPFKTINHAINNAWVTGDIIYVMNGTYQNTNYGSGNLNNGSVVYINKKGTLNGPLVIKNYSGHKPKIQFDGSGGFICGTAQFLEISGFEIQGPSKKITKEEAEENRLIQDKYFSGKGIAIWASGTQSDGFKGHHIVLHSNKVYDCPGSGIRINNSDYCVITNNEVSNTTNYSPSGESAIVLAQAFSIDVADKIKMRITKNKVYDNINKMHYVNTNYTCADPTSYGCADFPNIIDGSGCYITRNNDRGTGAYDENPNGQYEGFFYFANNIAYGNGINGLVVHKSDNSIVMNNSIYLNGAVPLDEGRQSAGGIAVNASNNVRIYNNISWSRFNSDAGYQKYNSCSDIVGANNLLIKGGQNIPALNGSVTTLQETDALFVDKNNFDFHLTTSSNAINGGVLSANITPLTGDVTGYNYLPKSDIENNDRTLNTSDIGAYETVDLNSNGIADHLKRNDYNFDNVLDNEGFIGNNGVTLTQPTIGEINLAISDANNYPKLLQNNNFFVDADVNKKVQITLVNQSPKNKINFVVTDVNGLNSSFTGDFITASDGVTEDLPQTLSLNLSENTNWTGEQSDWFLQLLQTNPLTKSAGTIKIQQILFYSHKWTGATDNDWNNISNWDSGTIPNSSSNIIIPSGLINYPTVNSDVSINSILIESGATLISTSNFSGTVTYTRNLATDNWYLISSPVKNETLGDFLSSHTFASGSNTNIGLAPYDNSQSDNEKLWNYFSLDRIGYLEQGLGYSLKLNTASTLSFSGDFPSEDVSNLVLTDNSNSNGSAYNLIGNPYPSYISLNNLLINNNSGASDLLAESTIWLWNGTGYITRNLNHNFQIAAGQSFFVKADGTSNNFTISEAMQSHQTTDTFLKTEKSNSEILLQISDGITKKDTQIYYLDGATTGFDDGYDSSVFEGVAAPFLIYTKLVFNNESQNLAIQSVPKEYENLVIPLGINANEGKEITFSLTSNNFPEEIKIYLEDNQANTFTRLDEENTIYKIVASEKLNGSGRFFIHTSSKALSTPYISYFHDIVLFTSWKNKELILKGNLEKLESLTVYDIQGKLVLNQKIKTDKNELAVSTSILKAGIYLVKVVCESIVKTQKIIIY